MDPKEYLMKDLEKDFEKGDIIQIKGNQRIYIIKSSPENLIKYSPHYFKKRGRKAKVSLLIKHKKMGGGVLENIFNKREDENMKLTIPYKYFHDTMEYFNIMKKKSNPEEKKDSFFSSVDNTKMTLITSNGSKDLKKEDKNFLFNFGSKEEELPKKEEPPPTSLFSMGEPEKKEEEIVKEEKDETREREMKVVLEGEILEYTREYYEEKRREGK
jgi:hypothetical protein